MIIYNCLAILRVCARFGIASRDPLKSAKRDRPNEKGVSKGRELNHLAGMLKKIMLSLKDPSSSVVFWLLGGSSPLVIRFLGLNLHLFDYNQRLGGFCFHLP